MASLNEGEPLLRILKDRDKYYAHTHISKPYETLDQHLKLVVRYFLKLIEEHHLEPIIDAFILDGIPENITNKEKVGNYIKEAFFLTILYHDFGKINHLFQEKKMKNSRGDFEIVEHKVDSQHSIISAYIYLMHVLDNDFLEYNDIEQTFTDAIISSFAYPIVKHHAKYLDSVLDIDFDNQEHLFYKYLKLFEKDMPQNVEVLHEIATDIETSFKQFDKLKVNHFNFYVLLKLNFSLLTASDYYATGEYMQDLKVDDFGLVKGKIREKVIQNFKHIKSYNKNLFEKTELLKNISFEGLQEQSNKNLNLLRQKLAAEVLTNLRLFSDDHLFYLEAPTGAGKTNVSLACAIELLESNERLNKIFYVFPFTTLVTQTFEAIKESLAIDNEYIIQLHSKSGFHQKNEEANDGNYGEKRLNFINNHFVNYPFTLLTHIKFFDILKGNSKETNYIFHRLANSIVIIDELQSYNPKHWDKVIYFLSNYAKLFNMKIILMSATLPKIDNLLEKNSPMKGKVKYLISPESKTKFFQNSNFAGRVSFDYSILDKYNWKRPNGDTQKEKFLQDLVEKIFVESEKYAATNKQKVKSVRTLVEFITKKTASKFLKMLQTDRRFKDYKLYLISGEILDPRRRQIINAIKANQDEKVILVTTQVVEAGVDIDMDLGFKDRSLIDSDEQLAGRVNRNASKSNCKVFLFDYDTTSFIYKGDKRLDVGSMYQREVYKNILDSKDFDTNFYEIVKNEIISLNQAEAVQNFSDYLQHFKRFRFRDINTNFKLIEQENESIFVPLIIPIDHFSSEDQKVVSYFCVPTIENENGVLCIDGKDVWSKYVDIVTEIQGRNNDYFSNQTQLKQIYGLLAKFMFSAFSNQVKELSTYFDLEVSEQYGIRYMSHWKKIYSYEKGIDVDMLERGDIFL